MEIIKILIDLVRRFLLLEFNFITDVWKSDFGIINFHFVSFKIELMAF